MAYITRHAEKCMAHSILEIILYHMYLDTYFQFNRGFHNSTYSETHIPTLNTWTDPIPSFIILLTSNNIDTKPTSCLIPYRYAQELTL